MKQTLIFFALALVFAALSGCSTMQDDPRIAQRDELQLALAQRKIGKIEDELPPESTAAAWQERPGDEIAPGYSVRVECPQDPKMSGTFQVNHEGALELPYEIAIQAGGKTLDELKQAIALEYGRFLRSPQLRVAVEKRKYYVDVRGLVQEPGQYLLEKDSSLDELIAKAGGLQRGRQEQTSAKYVKIKQLGVTQMIKLRDYFSGASQLVPAWQGGETIFFQDEGPPQHAERDYIQVLGQVTSPGEYPYKANAGFLDYLAEAGGPTDRADLYRITLLKKKVDGGVEHAYYDLDSIDNMPQLYAGDTLLIPGESTTPLQRQSGIAAAFSGFLSSILVFFLI